MRAKDVIVESAEGENQVLYFGADSSQEKISPCNPREVILIHREVEIWETGSKIKFIHTGYLILELQVPDLDLRAILYMGTMGCRANMKAIS